MQDILSVHYVSETIAFMDELLSATSHFYHSLEHIILFSYPCSGTPFKLIHGSNILSYVLVLEALDYLIC